MRSPPPTAGRFTSASCASKFSHRGSCLDPRRCCARATAGASSYAGPIGPGTRELRAADALCIDASFARADVRLPARAEALASIGAAVRDALAAGDSPVLLVEPTATALDVAAALASDRVGLAAHRDLMMAAAA
jgi:hypothetical protein